MATVDQGFVPAPPGRVYARLADVDGYRRWWPDAPPGLSGDDVAKGSRREGIGLTLRLRGRGASGSLEWYLEPFKDGTVVNAILELGGARPRAVMRVRASLREAMVVLRRWGEAT